MNDQENANKLERKFRACRKMLTVFGEEARQNLLMLMLTADLEGVRVADLADRMNLTRPAVSHHMQILKDTGLVKARKEGKCIYYSLDPQWQKIDSLLDLFTDIKQMLQDRPDAGSSCPGE